MTTKDRSKTASRSAIEAASAAAVAIKLPLSEWPGRCHEIAARCLVAGLVRGTLRYGLYNGPIAATGLFGGRSTARHGWVEIKAETLPDPLELETCEHCGCLEDEHPVENAPRCDEFSLARRRGEPALIFDPTRWVFEDVAPYLHEGPDSCREYDVASDQFRLATLRPCPTNSDDREPFELVLGDLPAKCLAKLIAEHGGPTITVKDGALSVTRFVAIWLANLPLSLLGPAASALYRELDRLGCRAFIPLDNREVVMGNGFYGHRPQIK